MTSTFKQIQALPQEPELYKSKESNLVVLRHAEGKSDKDYFAGTVIYRGKNTYPIGHYSNGWFNLKFERVNAEGQTVILGYGTKYVINTVNDSSAQSKVINIIPLGAGGSEGAVFSVSVVVGIPYGVIILSSPGNKSVAATSTVSIPVNVKALPDGNISYQLYERPGDATTGDGTPVADQTTPPFSFVVTATKQYRYSASNGVEIGTTGETVAYSSWFKITAVKASWGSTKPTLGTITSAGNTVTVPIATLPAGETYADCEYIIPGGAYTPVPSNPFSFTAPSDISPGGLMLRIAETDAKDPSDTVSNPSTITIVNTTAISSWPRAGADITGANTNSVGTTVNSEGVSSDVLLTVNSIVFTDIDITNSENRSGFLGVRVGTGFPTSIADLAYGVYTFGTTVPTVSTVQAGTTTDTSQPIAGYAQIGLKRTSTQIIPVISSNGTTFTEIAGFEMAAGSSLVLNVCALIYRVGDKLTNTKIQQ